MQTAIILILSVLCFFMFCVAGSFFNLWQRDARWKKEQLAVEREWDAQAVGNLLGIGWGQSIRKNIQPRIENLIFERDELLRQKQGTPTAKVSVFDNDKIPDSRSKPVYVPIARRRAQAEAASLGPKNHDDKVRENNARAIESAG